MKINFRGWLKESFILERTLAGICPVFLLLCFAPLSTIANLAPISNPASSQNNADTNESGMPTINCIGETAIMTYEQGKDLVIPIEGDDLYATHDAWSVTVKGVVSAIPDIDYRVLTFGDDPGNLEVSPEKALVILSSNYLAKVQDGDPLTVSAEISDLDDDTLRKLMGHLGTNNVYIENARNQLQTNGADLTHATNALEVNDLIDQLRMLSELDKQDVYSLDLPQSEKDSLIRLYNKYSEINGKELSDQTSLNNLATETQTAQKQLSNEFVKRHRFSTVATGFRVFQLYSEDYYRSKFLHTRLQLNEIKAFPLPDSQTKEIFGDKVSQHFYVVAFSAINNSSQERLVNAGLINAYGRAIVYDIAHNETGEPAYSIPVQVSPESLQQVYSDVVSSKWNSPREWFFRSLDFGGAVASAFATGFSGTPDLIKGLGLTTSTIIPGAKTLWPDQVPNHLENIVNFGMPELIKIAANSSLGFKLLFFSKDDIHSMISDTKMYGQLHNNVAQVLFAKDSYEKPKTFVVYLSFDTLEVPYETIATNALAAPEPTVVVTPLVDSKYAGQPETFTLQLTGVPPFKYQWFYGNTPIAGAIDPTYNIPSVNSTNVGFYHVVVTDGSGNPVTSANASLTLKQ